MPEGLASLDAGTRDLLEQGCGRRVGRFVLLRRIAQGGMAEVYVARSQEHSGAAHRVAIKKILPQFSHNSRFTDMLADEARITVSLTHPAVAEVYELGRDGQDYFIVMEYVDGRPLNKLMQRVDECGMGTIDVHHAAHIMAEVASGLHHAHTHTDSQGNNRHIVHRDVSPQNILLSFDGKVKLIDFGIARAEGRVNRTSAGVIKGKLRYLAPEIAEGLEPDHRADIFCCGIVLFEMLTSEAMFSPKSDFEAIEMAMQARVRSPRSRNPDVPEELDNIVMKALRRNREERYQSGEALCQDLRRFLRRHYPSYLPDDLRELMQYLFTGDIREDRRLDTLADRTARQLDDDDFDDEDPTQAAVPPVDLARLPRVRGHTGQYRQLVTRVGIMESGLSDIALVSGADGGLAMRVVRASQEEIPTVKPMDLEVDRPTTLPPQTLPPQKFRPPVSMVEVESIEQTVRTDMVLTPIPSTVIAPSRISREMAPVRGSLRTSQVVAPLVPPDEEATQTKRGHPDEEATQTKRGHSPGRTSNRQGSKQSEFSQGELAMIRHGRRRVSTFSLLVALAFIGLAVGIFWASTERAGVKKDVAKTEPAGKGAPADLTRRDEIELSKVPVDPRGDARTTAILQLDVSPMVPVGLKVDGRVFLKNTMPPVEVPGLPAGQDLELKVTAKGYLPARIVSRLAANSKTPWAVTLEPATGSIVVEGMKKGFVLSADVGEVKGRRIDRIPLGSTVSVRVMRPGQKTVKKQFRVTRRGPYRFEIPVVRGPAKGTLIVDTRPVSDVYIDGRFRGQTPVKIRLAPRKYRILVKGPSQKRLEVTRRVRSGKVTRFQTTF